MNRIFPVVAFVLAIGVAGTAIYELNQRSATTPPWRRPPPSPIASPTAPPRETLPQHRAPTPPGPP